MLRHPGDAPGSRAGRSGRGRCRPAGGAASAASSRDNGTRKFSPELLRSERRPPQPRPRFAGQPDPLRPLRPAPASLPAAGGTVPGDPRPAPGSCPRSAPVPLPPGRPLRCGGRAGAGRRGPAANGRPWGEPARPSRGPGSMSAGQSWVRAAADHGPARPPCARACRRGGGHRAGAAGRGGPGGSGCGC